MPKLLLTANLAITALLLSASFLMAQDKSRIPPMAVYQAMLTGNKDSGWVQFRNYNGEQWIYFTSLQTLHCRLAEIRYSVNSEALDKKFPLADCNPQNPMALPPDAGIDHIAIRLPLGTAKTIAVQVVWEDSSASAVAVYEPCENVGEQTCAWPLK
ncbi:MAG: hypothetical protein AB3N20_22045 [Rhizobiaceae bacterium]